VPGQLRKIDFSTPNRDDTSNGFKDSGISLASGGSCMSTRKQETIAEEEEIDTPETKPMDTGNKAGASKNEFKQVSDISSEC
jgi:hypothetical protein